MKHTRVLLVVLALVMAVAACGGSDSADETTATTSAATTEATTATTQAPATTAAATDTTAAPATTEGSGDVTGTTIEVVTQGDRFDTDEIRVKAGQEVTIVVTDKDTETDDPHNFHVRAGDLNFFTNIEEAPNTQEITFTISEPGEYTFFCDTHAETMLGTFIVEP